MRAVLTGTGSPRPSLRRAGPSNALLIGDEWVLIDCGDRATTQLMLAGIPPQQITKLFYTHAHTDHTVGFAQFAIGGWAMGRRALEVYGPRDVPELTEKLFHDVYRVDLDYRTSLGRPPEGIRDIRSTLLEDGSELDFGGWRVLARAVKHAVPTVALRFEHNGRSVVFSGDTTYCENLVDLARGADLLVCEACLWKTRYFEETPEGQQLWRRLEEHHLTPMQAGVIAHQAGVKRLVLNHLLPEVDEAAILAKAQKVFSGEVVVAEDLMAFDV